jgi:hypothetical protein
VVVQAQLQDKNTTSEETPMSTQSKSSGGFWIKVIFWLVIIILGFMYIRSLAKNPVDQATGESSGSEQVEVAASNTDDQSADEAAASAPEATAAEEVADSQQEAASAEVESAQSEQVATDDAASEGEGNPVSGSMVSADNKALGDAATQSEEAQAQASDDAAAASQQTAQEATSSQDEQLDSQDAHTESVTKILKEFDDLRDAAQAEREAMQNRMQAERELHEAMMPPPPRMWRNPNPGYGPYGPAPGPYQGYYNYR